MGVGGGSADRKAEELAASGDRSAGAWAAGAEGERRVAEALSHLPESWTVMHDRLLSPGRSPVNLDHVVVGPGGAFFIDAKNWRGSITAWEDGLFQHTGPRESRTSESKHQEVAKVHGMAAFMAAEAGMRVTPVICLAGRNESDFAEPQLIRGVWVIGASQVTAWLRAQPVTLEREQVERAAVTLLTSFPSTTTDVHLLAAMGAASQAAQPRRRRVRRAQETPSSAFAAPGARSTPPARPPRRRRRVFGRALQLILALAFLGSAFALLKALPGILLDGVAAATSSTAPVATPGVADAPTAPSNRSSSSPPRQTPSTKAKASATPAAQPVSRCSGLTAEQVGDIVGLKVHPVAERFGCSWGTRLDDPKTVVLTLRTQADYRPTDFQYVSSASQRRVVYGAAYDNNYQPATALWVATGQPIVGKQRTVTARTNTHVVVSTKDLKTTDEKARWMARAIAMAVNATP